MYCMYSTKQHFVFGVKANYEIVRPALSSWYEGTYG